MAADRSVKFTVEVAREDGEWKVDISDERGEEFAGIWSQTVDSAMQHAVAYMASVAVDAGGPRLLDTED